MSDTSSEHTDCTCEHCQTKSKGGNFLTGMAMGVVLGGAMAYMYSSPEGKKKAHRLVDEGAQMLAELLEKTEGIRQQAKEAGVTLADQVRQAHGDESLPSFGAQIRQRFFKKNGQKLT